MKLSHAVVSPQGYGGPMEGPFREPEYSLEVLPSGCLLVVHEASGANWIYSAGLWHGSPRQSQEPQQKNKHKR